MNVHKEGRRPAMRDVADVAGVSHQTVSRVLNNNPSVAPDTRQKVLDAIAELGYRRNSAARALVTSRTNIVGVMTDASGLFGPTSTLVAIEEAAREESYFVSVATVEQWAHDQVSHALEHFMSQGVDGVIVLAGHDDAVEAVRSFESSAPIVIVAAELSSDGRIITAAVDQREGARLAVRHLLELGHRHVTHVAGPPDWFDARARVEGWRVCLEAAGIEPGEPIAGDWSSDRGYEVGRELLTGELPTAIFAANDQLSLGILHALAEGGVRVPEQVSLVGFDDIPGSSHFWPPLTTVAQEFDRLGRECLRLVVEMIDGNEPESLPISPRLVVRASAAAPRS